VEFRQGLPATLEVHQETHSIWGHESLSAKQIATFPSPHQQEATAYLHMSGKLNYAQFESRALTG
jgi:hypothetical protein